MNGVVMCLARFQVRLRRRRGRPAPRALFHQGSRGPTLTTRSGERITAQASATTRVMCDHIPARCALRRKRRSSSIQPLWERLTAESRTGHALRWKRRPADML